MVLFLGECFFGYKVYNSNKTNKKAEDVVSQFDKNTDNTNNEDKDSSNNNSSEADGNNSSLQDILDNLGNDNSNSIYQQQGNKDTYYEGYKVIGTISIPSIDVEYPILEEYPQDPANAVNKPGNLVLWGHNYKNGTFFSDIGKLTTGAKIYIKDTSGTKLEYQVYNSYETTDSDMTYATRETNGAREITLSTCSNESGKRIIVYAKQT